MKTFASTIANLCCPDCNTVQSLWLARTTYVSKFPLHVTLNKYFLCSKCNSELHLVATRHGALLWLGRFVALSLNFAVFSIVFLTLMLVSNGLWTAIFAVVIFLIVSNIWALALDGLFVRNFYKLENTP